MTWHRRPKRAGIIPAQHNEPKHCGTCKHALRFTFPDSPGGPEDGVHCDSPLIATEVAEAYDDEPSRRDRTQEFEEFGYCLY